MKSSKNLKYIFRITHKCKPRNGVSEDKTNRLPVITEIDISRQSRALSWLRLTDYTLVVICGFMAAFALSELVVSFLSDTTVDRILLQLFKKAGVAAKKTTGIKPINKPRGLVIGTVGLLILAALIIAPKLGNEDLALASPIFQRSSSCWASSCFCGRDDISRSMPTLCLPSTSGHQFYSCGLLMTTKNRNSGGQTRHCWISLWKPGWPTTFPGSAFSSLLVRQRKRSPS